MMGPLTALLHRCANHREPATTLALFRILLCASTLYSLALMTNADVFEATWVPANEGGMVPLSSRHWLFRALGGLDAESARHVYHLSWATCLLGLVGFGGRGTLLLAQQSYVAMRSLNENSTGGYDSLIGLGLLILACSQSTATLSTDCLLTFGRVSRLTAVSAWPRAILVFQVLFMYTMTGLQKIGYSWTPMGGYAAMHYILNDPTWLRWDLGEWPWRLEPLLRVCTAVAWHWEQLSLLLLLHWYYRVGLAQSPSWLRSLFTKWDWRYPWVFVGVVLHSSILALFDVGPFSLVSMAYYVNLWSPWEWHRFSSRWRSRKSSQNLEEAPQGRAQPRR